MFREKKQISILCLAGAVALAFVLFRFLPLRQKRKALERARAAQALVIAKVAAERDQLPALRKRLQEMQAVIGDYEQRVPNKRDLGDFLQRIANLMNEQNLREQLIQPGQEIEVDGLICIPIDMRCKGALEQIFEFYKSLRTMNRLIRIEEVKLLNDKNFGGAVSMRTKGAIYYTAEPAEG